MHPVHNFFVHTRKPSPQAAHMLQYLNMNTTNTEKVNFKDITKIPNLLSVGRLFASGVLFFAAVRVIEAPWVTILYIIALASDKADGIIARATNTKTVLGLYLETVVDSLFALVTFLYLVRVFAIPQWVLCLGLGMFLIGLCANLALYFRRRFFVATSLISSRAAVFVFHTTGIWYFFHLPRPEIPLSLAVIAGILAFADYIYRLFSAKERVTKAF